MRAGNWRSWANSRAASMPVAEEKGRHRMPSSGLKEEIEQVQLQVEQAKRKLRPQRAAAEYGNLGRPSNKKLAAKEAALNAETGEKEPVA